MFVLLGRALRRAAQQPYPPLRNRYVVVALRVLCTSQNRQGKALK
jgi:hypothetical protein